MTNITGKLVKIYDNMQLRWKLGVAYLVIIFIPLVIMGFFLMRKATLIIDDQSGKSVDTSMQQLVQNINNQLRTYEELANLLYYDDNLNGYLGMKYANEGEIYDAFTYITKQMENLLKARKDIRQIGIYYDNDSFFPSAPVLADVHDYLARLPEYEKIKQAGFLGYWGSTKKVQPKKAYWQEYTSLAGTTEDDVVFSYNRFLNYSNHKPVGVLTLEIRERELYDLIEKEGRDKNIYLVDEKGSVVTSNIRKLLGKSVANEDFYSVLSGRTGGIDSLKTEKGRFRLSFSSARNGWKLIFMVPQDNLYKQTQSMMNFGIAFIFSSLLISMIMIFLFSKLINKRIDILMHRINSMKEGNIITEDHIEGRDEIGMLDRSFSNMAQSLKYYINEVYVLNLRKKEAELLALQSQINPHFLYNTLSTVNWMLDKCSSDDIRKLVENLTMYYRSSLSKGREIITIREEIEGVKAYLEIQRYRMDNRIQAYFNISSVILEVPILKMILQPLVENCIDHGIGTHHRNISILVNGRKEGPVVVLEVIDDGVGMSAEKVESLMDGSINSENGSGYGFKNVNQRIKLHFGEQYGLSVSSTPGVSTRVTVTIPLS